MLVPYLTESSLHNYFEHLEHAIIFSHLCVVLRCLSPVHSLFVLCSCTYSRVIVVIPCTCIYHIPLFWMLWMFWVWYMRALLMVFLPLWHMDWWCSLSLSSKIPRAHRLKVPCAPLNTCGASLVLSLALHPVEIPKLWSLHQSPIGTCMNSGTRTLFIQQQQCQNITCTLLCAWY